MFCLFSSCESSKSPNSNALWFSFALSALLCFLSSADSVHSGQASLFILSFPFFYILSGPRFLKSSTNLSVFRFLCFLALVGIVSFLRTTAPSRPPSPVFKRLLPCELSVFIRPNGITFVGENWIVSFKPWGQP